MSEAIGWEEKGRELCNSFCFSLKWRNGSASRVVFSRALLLGKDSQSNLSRQRLDVSPNALDNSLSAVRTSPRSAIKTKLPSNALSFLPAALKKDSASRSCSGEEVFDCIQTIFPFENLTEQRIQNKIATEKWFGFMLSLIGSHKILFTHSIQRELSKYCRKSECVHCGNVLLINALWHSYEVRKKP